MTVAATLKALGGCGTWAELREVHTERAVKNAVLRAEIERVARGRYALATVADHRREAQRRSGVLSDLSAAQHHGWKVKTPPEIPYLTVPRKRHVRPEDRATAHVSCVDLSPGDVDRGVTTHLRTVLDCARRLPFDEALAVADSALRSRDIDLDTLQGAAAALRGPGATAARRVAAFADGRSANPLESVLRAILLEIPELRLVPQVAISGEDLFAVVDLADVGKRLVIEAEGFEYHGRRAEWRADCQRYTALTVNRWWVLRFTWEEVMHRPEVVRQRVRTWLTGLAEQAIAC